VVGGKKGRHGVREDPFGWGEEGEKRGGGEKVKLISTKGTES